MECDDEIINNPFENNIFRQKASFKRSSGRYEDNEFSGFEAKRSRMEIAVSGSSSSQAAGYTPCDMMMDESVPTSKQFGINKSVSNKSSQGLGVGGTAVFSTIQSIKPITFSTPSALVGQSNLTSEDKRSSLEVAAAGSSSSQAAGYTPCDMMMDESVSTLNPFGINIGISNKSFQGLGVAGPNGFSTIQSIKPLTFSTPSALVGQSNLISEDKRSGLEVAAAGSSSSQAAGYTPREMMMDENTLGEILVDLFGKNIGVSEELEEASTDEFSTIQSMKPLTLSMLSAVVGQSNLNIPPFTEENYGKGEPIYQFHPKCLHKCVNCLNSLQNAVVIVCETNLQHMYCVLCTWRYIRTRSLPLCPSGQNCIGRNSAKPWLISESLAGLISELDITLKFLNGISMLHFT